jgi:hypothetical protein
MHRRRQRRHLDANHTAFRNLPAPSTADERVHAPRPDGLDAVGISRADVEAIPGDLFRPAQQAPQVGGLVPLGVATRAWFAMSWQTFSGPAGQVMRPQNGLITHGYTSRGVANPPARRRQHDRALDEPR